MPTKPANEPARPRSTHPTGRYAAMQSEGAQPQRVAPAQAVNSTLLWQFILALVVVGGGTAHLTRWWVLRDAGFVASTSTAHTANAATTASAPHAIPSPVPTASPPTAVADAAKPDPGQPWQLVDPDPVFVEGQSMPLRALVRMPASLRPRQHPLAVLVHGTHGLFRHGDNIDRCPEPGGSRPHGSQVVNSAAGLVWLADTLAAQGMVAVVLDASALTCVFGLPGAHKRKELTLGLLKRWSTWQARGDGPLSVDVVEAVHLKRLVLIGHSSGADGVALVASELAHPRNPLAGQVQAAAILVITPPDFVRLPHMPCPVAVWVAGCDGDVGAGSGERMFDRWATAAAGQPAVLWSVAGAVHNAANDQWRDEALDGAAQTCQPNSKVGVQAERTLLGAAAAAWLGAVVRGQAPPA